MSRSSHFPLSFFLFFLLTSSNDELRSVSAFLPSSNRITSTGNSQGIRLVTFLFADNTSSEGSNNSLSQKKKKGYQFGDISKSVFKSFGDNVNKLTGKESYEFGDLTKWIDVKAKEKVNEYTEKEQYEFGDITKTILKKFMSGEYTLNDLMTFVKIVSAIGLNFQPMAPFIPTKVLVELLEVSVAQDIGSKIVESLASEVDQRMKEALTGSRDYQLGDILKKSINKFTEKEEYSFGDITSKILDLQSNNSASKSTGIIGSTEMSTKLANDLMKVDEARSKQ